MSRELSDLVECLCVPYADGPIVRSSGEPAAVGREGDGEHPIAVSTERGQQRAAGNIPYAGSVISGRSREPSGLRAIAQPPLGWEPSIRDSTSSVSEFRKTMECSAEVVQLVARGASID